MPMATLNTAVALFLGVSAASATMLGWVLATRGRPWRRRTLGVTLLLTAVAMILISVVELLPGALDGGLPWIATAAWAVAGALGVLALRFAARLFSPESDELVRSAGLIAVAIGLHNIPEGAATAGATLLSLRSGVVTAVAMALHNIPEGIAIAAPIMAGGGSRRRAFWYTGVAAGAEALGAVLALTFSGAVTDDHITGMLALVAGVMIALSVVELVPSGMSLMRAGSDRPHQQPTAGAGHSR